jgi:hypothetical protein
VESSGTGALLAFDTGTDDVGHTGSAVTGSSIEFGTTKEIVRSGAITLTNDNRLIVQKTNGTNLKMHAAFIVEQVALA